MNFQTCLSILLLVVALLGSGCTNPQQITSPAPSCESIPSIPGSDLVPDTSQVFPKQIQDLRGRVAALNFSSDGLRLTAMYATSGSEPGHVLTWEVKNGVINKQLTIANIDPNQTVLSNDGTTLITMINDQQTINGHRQSFNSPDEVRKLIDVWNLTTDNRQKLLPLYDEVYDLQQIILSPSGQTILKVSATEAYLASTDPKITQRGELIFKQYTTDLGDVEPQDNFVIGAFDKSGEKFALAFESGDIWVREVRDEVESETFGKLSSSLPSENRRPVAMAYDFANNQLVVFRNGAIELYPLDTWRAAIFPRFFFLRSISTTENVPMTEKGIIAVSPSGKWLAIGTSSGWQLRRGNDLTLVTEKQNVAVASLAFSPNDCTVAVGSPQGVIELWSLPQP